jgi:hypothetical protein
MLRLVLAMSLLLAAVTAAAAFNSGSGGCVGRGVSNFLLDKDERAEIEPSRATRTKIAEGLRLINNINSSATAGADFCSMAYCLVLERSGLKQNFCC